MTPTPAEIVAKARKLRVGRSDTYFLVDEPDYFLLKRHTFRLNAWGYVCVRFEEKRVRKSYILHRILVGCPDDMVVDHINGDRLDNRRSNLRICTRQQNTCHRIGLSKNNTTGAAGVNPHYGKWRATIRHKGHTYRLGVFPTRGEAIQAREAKERELWGEFAPIRTHLKSEPQT